MKSSLQLLSMLICHPAFRTTEKENTGIKKIMILTVEEQGFPFWILHYAQNLPQNQIYPSTSKEGEKDELKSVSNMYITNATEMRSTCSVPLCSALRQSGHSEHGQRTVTYSSPSHSHQGNSSHVCTMQSENIAAVIFQERSQSCFFTVLTLFIEH